LTILAPAKTRLSRVVLLGVGDVAKLDGGICTRIGGAAIAGLTGKDAAAVLLVDQFKGLKIAAGEAAAQIGFGARLRSYRFDKYFTKLKPEQKSILKNLTVACVDVVAAKAAYASLDKIADGVFLTRDLVSEPANVIYPERFGCQG
jgi:leucyl aminopeptidase